MKPGDRSRLGSVRLTRAEIEEAVGVARLDLAVAQELLSVDGPARREPLARIAAMMATHRAQVSLWGVPYCGEHRQVTALLRALAKVPRGLLVHRRSLPFAPLGWRSVPAHVVANEDGGAPSSAGPVGPLECMPGVVDWIAREAARQGSRPTVTSEPQSGLASEEIERR